MSALEVLSTGPWAGTQDHGRPGHAAWGIGASGAADLGSHDLANRLVGNDPGAASLEVLLGGLGLRALGRVALAVTGAQTALTVQGRPAPLNALLRLEAGHELRIATPTAGLRSYVAVRGGLDVDRVLGSAAVDTLSGIGPAPLAVGDVLGVGERRRDLPSLDHAPVAPVGASVGSGPLLLDWTPGPRADWFTPRARALLAGATWRVGTHSDRVGVRLDGPPLERAVTDELPTEPMVLGAVQVPPSGPIVFGPDHPVTGGYPVIAVVGRAGLDRLAQAVPGTEVRLARGPGVP